MLINCKKYNEVSLEKESMKKTLEYTNHIP